MITQKFKSLQKVDLSTYKKEIAPLNPGWYEYNNFVGDYGNEVLAVTNRLIPPYNGSENHEENFYDDIVEVVNEYKPFLVIDLGCASGELLSKITCKHKYGLTIHTGEVKYAHDTFGLSGVVPADMREVDTLFKPNSIDMVIAFWSFNYLTEEDKKSTIDKIHKILLPEGTFVHVDEYSHPETTLTEFDDDKFFIADKKMIKWGELTILKKRV